MIIKEIIMILKQKTSIILGICLLFSSAIVMRDVIKNPLYKQDDQEFIHVMKDIIQGDQNLYQSCKSEYIQAVSQDDVYAKKIKTDLIKEQLEDSKQLLEWMVHTEKNHTDMINTKWNAYTFRRYIRMASLYGTIEYQDQNPFIVFQKEIIAHPEEFQSKLTTEFDYIAYTSMRYHNGNQNELQKHNEYNDQMMKAKSSYEAFIQKAPNAIYDYRGPELYHTLLLRNDSLFGIASLLCAFIFFLIHNYQYYHLRIDQYYASFPYSRKTCYTRHLFCYTTAFIILYLAAYFLPFIVLLLNYHLPLIHYPTISNISMFTSYQGTQNLYDGIYTFIPYVSTNPGPDLPFYPTLSSELRMVPLGITMLKTMIMTLIQIIVISVTTQCLVLNVRKQYIILGCSTIMMLLFMLTRIYVIPIISWVPLFIPSSIYLISGGHGIGMLSLYFFSIIWIILFLWLGRYRINHIDLMEG